MNKLIAWLRRYRLPITIGAGGVAAVTAFTSAQNRAAATRAASQVAAGAPFVAAGLTPEQVASLIGQGGQLAINAQAPLVGLASGGLTVAGAAAAGAQAVSQVALGNLGAAAGVLGDLAGQIVGVLPSFAPIQGITPQLTVLPAPPPAYVPPQITYYQPPIPPYVPPAVFTPPPVAAATLVGYHLSVSGTLTLYTLTGSTFVPHPATFTNSSAPVRREIWAGRVAWVTDAGAYKGLAYVVGLTGGSWSISRKYSDGTYQPIAQSGS